MAVAVLVFVSCSFSPGLSESLPAPISENGDTLLVQDWLYSGQFSGPGLLVVPASVLDLPGVLFDVLVLSASMTVQLLPVYLS